MCTSQHLQVHDWYSRQSISLSKQLNLSSVMQLNAQPSYQITFKIIGLHFLICCSISTKRRKERDRERETAKCKARKRDAHKRNSSFEHLLQRWILFTWNVMVLLLCGTSNWQNQHHLLQQRKVYALPSIWNKTLWFWKEFVFCVTFCAWHSILCSLLTPERRNVENKTERNNINKW